MSNVRRFGRKKPGKAATAGAHLDYLTGGLVGISEAKVPFRRMHCHDDIEVSVNEHHPVEAMFGGQRLVLPPDYLVVFWAARPHGPIQTSPGGWAHGVHLPLPWVLQWGLPAALTRPLLAGTVLLDRPGKRPAADLKLVKDWVRLLQSKSPESQHVVLLEVEARLRRLAIELAGRETAPSPQAEPPPPSRGAIGRFEKMVTLIAKHFHEPLSLADIATAVRMTPPSAMRLFRKFSGMTLHEHLVQHRVSHAQWLLTTTDVAIDEIAAQSGFGSPARFYAYFRQITRLSPSAYRRQLRGPDGRQPFPRVASFDLETTR